MLRVMRPQQVPRDSERLPAEQPNLQRSPRFSPRHGAMRGIRVGLTTVGLLGAILLPVEAQSLDGSFLCERLRLTTWSDAESVAWRDICQGQVANFHERFGKLDPGSRDGWDQKRKLSRRFLETILLEHRFRSAIPRRGIRISGAWLNERVDLVNAKLDSELRIEQSRFEEAVLLSRLKTPFVLSFRGSMFAEPVQLDGISVGEVLDLRESSFKKQCDMTSAKVERH